MTKKIWIFTLITLSATSISIGYNAYKTHEMNVEMDNFLSRAKPIQYIDYGVLNELATQEATRNKDRGITQ